MKDQKIQIRFFTIADWQKEEAYLKKMHAQGWKFTKISIPCIYHFAKCPVCLCSETHSMTKRMPPLVRKNP